MLSCTDSTLCILSNTSYQCSSVNEFPQKILAKFVKLSILATWIRKCEQFSVDFKDPNNLVDDESSVIGFTTKHRACKLLECGDISERQYANIFVAAKEFFTRAI